jgi:hypothetical protein
MDKLSIEDRKARLIDAAIKRHGEIFPVIGGKGVTENGSELFYWFNTGDHSTHLMKERHLKMYSLKANERLIRIMDKAHSRGLIHGYATGGLFRRFVNKAFRFFIIRAVYAAAYYCAFKRGIKTAIKNV